MFRFLILLLCALFAACSSTDEPVALKQWFDDQNIATFYGKQYEEVDVSVKSLARGFNNSAYLIGHYAALGDANGAEHVIYFGLETLKALSDSWQLRVDSVFYANFPSKRPDKDLDATIYWLKESRFEHDSLWLKFPVPFTNHAKITLEQQPGGSGTTNAFKITLPEELRAIEPPNGDTLRLLVGIRLHESGTVLRIAKPDTSDVSGLLRAAQITNILENCEHCLHAGIRESLLVSFEISDKKIMEGRTVVFAELLLPKENGTEGSELGLPVPIWVYAHNNGVFIENYRIDSAYVKEHGYHPNFIFREKGDEIKLQVTNSLRNYASANPLPSTFDLSLQLGFPRDITQDPFLFSGTFYNTMPAYARYNFSAIKEGETAKLRLWFADYDNKK
ncbi:MAG: hypothetical protein LBU89_12700 [Fibromonadaceae bacterium]|jgi:hypothetical protein|nr:hypothetical protein [Fibromonadaceae bacterium]